MKVSKRIKPKEGIMLDIGSGPMERPGFVCMDKRPMPNVDIVHDWEKFPWPIKSESVITAVASHVFEHVKPWITLEWMDEVWRVMKVGGQFAISMPYGYSSAFLQDPTHCNMCNESTWTYFDPAHPLYLVYQPKPWRITFGPIYQGNGNMEVILTKLPYGKAPNNSGKGKGNLSGNQKAKENTSPKNKGGKKRTGKEGKGASR